jgi:hypothetical protein
MTKPWIDRWDDRYSNLRRQFFYIVDTDGGPPGLCLTNLNL